MFVSILPDKKLSTLLFCQNIDAKKLALVALTATIASSGFV
jgi:hypothetical protein